MLGILMCSIRSIRKLFLRMECICEVASLSYEIAYVVGSEVDSFMMGNPRTF